MVKKILVTMKNCGACPEAKKLLKKEGVRFKAVDVDSSEGKTLAKKHKITVVPVMIIDGKKTGDVRNWVRK